MPEPARHCPYRGLLPYDVDDAEAFFGRERRRGSVPATLPAAARSLAVVGPSGSGKSSLVRAGVARRCAREGRRVVVITPGAHPMESLSRVA